MGAEGGVSRGCVCGCVEGVAVGASGVWLGVHWGRIGVWLGSAWELLEPRWD